MDADQDDQTGHFMASAKNKIGPAEARENSMKLIADNMQAATNGVSPDGKMSSSALDHLGDAMHTLEDMTSPMHTTDDGTPMIWEGVGSMGSKGIAHWAGENDPSDSWARFGWAVRLTLAAYVQTNPVAAAKHGLNADNYENEANRRISGYISRIYEANGSRHSREEEAARQCALGNPAACVH
jgi:hypothetical protein